jgi:FAD/FMN-containing dehydrogenase
LGTDEPDLTNDLRNRLSEAIGTENIDIADGRIVVWPSTTDHVSEILRAANEVGAQVRVSGSGVSDHSDDNPSKYPLVLIARERLRGSWEYIREDLLLSVGAGVVLREVSSFLHSDNLLWPGMVGYSEGEQVSAVLDSAPGQNTTKGRRIRRFLYGLTVVFATGEIAKPGSRTVKSVAGYDLKALYLGSRSCFGVITECDLKLASKEEELIEAPDYSDRLSAVSGDSPSEVSASGSTSALQGLPPEGVSSSSPDPSEMIRVLEALKKKLDPNGILPSVESVGLSEGCR